MDIAVWQGRRHFVQTVQKAFLGNSTTDESSNTSILYRIAWSGMIGGIVILVFFGYKVGMSSGVAILFFLFYFALSSDIARLRAETGFPDRDVHFGGPVQMITSALGTANLSQSTRTTLPLFWFISHRLDPHIMPHQLEGFKIASRIRMSHKTSFWSMLLGCALEIVVTFWLLFHAGYKFGCDNILAYRSWGQEP